MTSRLALTARMGPRRESAFKRDRIYYNRRTVGPRKNHQKVTKSDSSSWWTGLKDRIVSTDSETGTDECASWTILSVDFGDNFFLGECMALFGDWAWCDEERKLMKKKYPKRRLPCGFCWREEEIIPSEWGAWWYHYRITDENGTFVCGGGSNCDKNFEYAERRQREDQRYDETRDPRVRGPCACYVSPCEDKELKESMKLFAEWTDEYEELEEGMKLFAEWTATAEDEEEIMAEPETHDSLLMAALLSTKQPLPSGLSCLDLLMASLAVLLFETRHLHYINDRLDLPPPPKWMVEAAREMDPIKSTVTEVAEVSASSSLSTLFMDPSSAHSSSSSLLTSSLSSLFAPCDCSKCQPAAHSAQSTTDSNVESTDSHHAFSGLCSSGYESDVDSEPVVPKNMTTTVSRTEALSQSSAAQMLAECDEMMEKVVEMKKRLRELL